MNLQGFGQLVGIEKEDVLFAQNLCIKFLD